MIGICNVPNHNSQISKRIRCDIRQLTKSFLRTNPGLHLLENGRILRLINLILKHINKSNDKAMISNSTAYGGFNFQNFLQLNIVSSSVNIHAFLNVHSVCCVKFVSEPVYIPVLISTFEDGAIS